MRCTLPLGHPERVGYLVETRGALVLPADREAAAFVSARAAMLAADGGLQEDQEVEDLAGLAELAPDVALTREGDTVSCETGEAGDPKWSDQATAFWHALAPFVVSGRVDFQGEDGSRWSYVFEGGRLTQDGRNGYDGTGSGVAHDGWLDGLYDPDDDEDEGDEAQPWGPPAALPPPGPSRETRGKRYLGFGLAALVGGVALLAGGRPSGWLAAAVGAFDLGMAWHLLKGRR
jgi:hypothetical protein